MAFRAGEQHPFSIDLKERLIVLKSMDLGSRKIVGDEIIRQGRSRQMIKTLCGNCGTTKLLHIDNLLKGASSNCPCQRITQYGPKARMLASRFDAIYQRCNNLKNKSYANYGGRGIMCLFERNGFVRYTLRLFKGVELSGLDIDRIDTNGNYEPGNLRLIDREGNLNNKRSTVMVSVYGEVVPSSKAYDRIRAINPDFQLSRGTTAKLARQGVTVEELIRRKPRSKRV
ncbi:hypothetical protein [Mesorhizobium sp. M0187]|uniref:hypothetical protein n=1 Tax=Mesorhizobium sp. M0187 TaxID=2956908 RepID=UPI003335DED4